VIWKHLNDHAVGIILAFAIVLDAGSVALVRAPNRGSPRFRPHQDGHRAAARRSGSHFHAVAGLGIWSKVALGVTLVFFIRVLNVYQGVKESAPPCWIMAACSA